MTFLDTLRETANARPHHIAFIAGGERWSFDRFAGEIERLARALSAHGVKPGDSIALHMANVPEMAIACFACFRLGAIAAPLNNRVKSVELHTLVKRLKPALYIGQDHLYPMAAPIDPGILPMHARFIVGTTNTDDGARQWDALFDHGDVADELLAPDQTAPALLLTTSGTTGEPKFVAHSLETLTAIADKFDHLGMSPNDIIANFCPMVHAGGLFPFIASIRYRAPTILLERFDPDVVLDAVQAHRATWVLGLPAVLGALLDRQQAQPRDMSSLRFCLSAGDVCPEFLQLGFPFAFGRPLHSIWGLTESVGVLAYGKRAGPFARIPANADIRIIDERGAPVRYGMLGELLVGGPAVALGYWTGPGTLEPLGPAGWLATGDIMQQVGEDTLRFVSRKKDLIVRAGSNISPVEVERVLKSHPAVREAAVLGIPDTLDGQRVVALIELSEEPRSEVLEDILAMARPQLADYKLPEQLRVVSEIPKNTFGKIERKSLSALWRLSTAR